MKTTSLAVTVTNRITTEKDIISIIGEKEVMADMNAVLVLIPIRRNVRSVLTARRYNNQDEEGGYRPQRSSYNPRFNNREDGGEQRPYRPRYSNGQQGEGGYRPQRSSYSPRYNKDENGEQRPYRPRYGNGQQGEGGYRSSRPYNGGQGGYSRPQGGRPRTADYNPNAKYSKKKQMEYKEILTDPNEPIRLNKFLANAVTP